MLCVWCSLCPASLVAIEASRGLTGRAGCRFTFQKLAEELGEETAARMCTEGGLHIGPILDADPEFEKHLPSVPNFLKVEGLTWVPL